ncbi:guanylate kinase [Butyrivibrio sp. JL13D10]|uniref:guanylate kinase n=1 Tax=Butyrivibrio sp. JL13D10 TaxID=3236815 RepID=UPI0038B5E8CF
MSNKGIIVVVSGFSGAGKGTLMKELIKRYDNYALSVSATTRQPRPGEENGREYFFITKEEFEKLISEDGLVEYANYVGNYYGTPKKFVQEKLDAGKDVILEIEIQGALQIKKKFPKALLLFITPPSVEELEKRLRGRGTETEDVIHGRLLRAKEEGQGIDEYDNIVINDNLDACVKQMHEIIQAAHFTPDRNKEFIEDIQAQLSELK